MKNLLLVLLVIVSCNAKAEWIKYSTRANGDVYFFNNARVQKNNSWLNVWSRIRYKSSIMGASSYQSLMKIDCSEHTETILQSTFYTDKNWTTPAMATDSEEKPKVPINTDSATHRLAIKLCN